MYPCSVRRLLGPVLCDAALPDGDWLLESSAVDAVPLLGSSGDDWLLSSSAVDAVSSGEDCLLESRAEV